MSSKRKFSEVSTEPLGASKPREHAHSRQSSSHKKRKDFHKDGPTSIGWIKKRVRAIERSLSHKDALPANVRHDLEKELDHHKQKLDDHADLRTRAYMIKKYHMIRFFERKKADRLAKQLRKQLEAATDEEERTKRQADLHIAETDALYARYFPHRERYVSLYPIKEGAKTDDANSTARYLHAERPHLWGIIEKAAKEGNSALVRIQERKPGEISKSKLSPGHQSKHSTAKRDQPEDKASAAPELSNHYKDKGKQQKAPKPLDSSSDNDSDGGFFEDG